MDGQVGGQGASRPRGLIFGGAVSTCLVLAWLFLSGGGTAAGSAAPVAAATDVPSTPSTTVTIYVTKTSYTPVPITETSTSIVTVTTTAVAHSTDLTTAVSTGTVTPPAPPPKTLILPGQGTTVTRTGQPPNTSAPSKGSQPPVITVPGAPTTVRGTKTVVTTVRADPSPTPGRLRWAAGTAGLAVTSAAGFGFLLLRRRGRYGL